MRLNLAAVSFGLMAMSSVLAAPVPVAQPAGGGLALVKLLNNPKLTASVMAGNIVALYYWLTNELDSKDLLKKIRKMKEEGEFGLQGLSDEDIERIRDAFMDAMAEQRATVGDRVPSVSGGNSGLTDYIEDPSGSS